MAIVVADLPKFSIEDGDDFDIFNHLYIGHLNTVGVNPNAVGGPPTGRSRAMGILRSCLKGSVANWFDKTFIGKNWKLKYLLSNGGANMNAYQALTVPQGAVAGSLNPNSLVPNSPADIYSRNGANALHTVQQAFLPGFNMLGGDTEWERAGAEPSDDAPNATGAGNQQPIVLAGIRPDQALSYMRRKLPPLIKKRRDIKLHKYVQGDKPIRIYWDELQRYGKMLGLPQPVLDDHFYKGLSPEASWEAERMDPELPTSKVTDILERIEERNKSMRTGPVGGRSLEQPKRNITPVEAPPVISQYEPAELRKVVPKAIAQEHLKEMFKSHTDNITKGFQDQIQAFQSQIQALQNTISQSQQKIPPPVPPKDHRRIHEWYEGHNPFDDNQQYNVDDVLGNILGDDREARQIAHVVARASAKAKKAKIDRQVNKLASALGNLNISDNESIPMDIDLADGSIILQDADGNEFTAFVTRGSKKK